MRTFVIVALSLFVTLVLPAVSVAQEKAVSAAPPLPVSAEDQKLIAAVAGRWEGEYSSWGPRGPVVFQAAMELVVEGHGLAGTFRNVSAGGKTFPVKGKVVNGNVILEMSDETLSRELTLKLDGKVLRGSVRTEFKKEPNRPTGSSIAEFRKI